MIKVSRGQGITEVIEDIGIRDEVLEAEGLVPKRGQDIKVFADLPLDVQQTIDRLSGTTEEHIKRTEAAINYQHLFLDRPIGLSHRMQTTKE